MLADAFPRRTTTGSNIVGDDAAEPEATGSLETEMATTSQIVTNVETSVGDLRAINAQYSNGGPPLPTSDGSGGSSGA
jgi:hypothetical protein